MDLRHLRTFVTVAEQGTVSKAALHLHIAQPALSRQIHDLEDALGVKLFDRVRRRLVLTGEGEQLLEHCRTVLGAAHTLTADDGSFDTGTLDGGRSARISVDAPGRYRYFCDIHNYMTGVIVAR